jgi:hypothetical protein
MAGPQAPEREQDGAPAAPGLDSADLEEFDPNGDAELAEDSAKAIEDGANRGPGPSAAAEQRRQQRRAARQKRKHGRR